MFIIILIILYFSLLLAEHYQELAVRSEMSQLATTTPDECAIRLLYISINWLRHLPSFRILSVADQVLLSKVIAISHVLYF